MCREEADETAPDERRTHVKADPLGRAMLAYHRDEPGQLSYRDGTNVQDGTVGEFYFAGADSWSRETLETLERLVDRESLLDVGCGAGTHLRWFVEHGVSTVGIDISPNAIRTARERGLEDVLVADMFDLPFGADEFGGVHVTGTQLGLGGSLAGIRELLAEFARITDEDGLAVVDAYDPTRADDDFFGYRSDPRPGLAHRCFHLEFERETEGGRLERAVGKTLHFLLYSPSRFRDAVGNTPWCLDTVHRSDGNAYYRCVLEKR